MDDSDAIKQMKNSDIPQINSDVNNKVKKNFNITVPQGLTTATVTFAKAEADTNYMILAVFNWFTNYKISAKTVNDFTVDFSVASPASAKADYVILR